MTEEIARNYARVRKAVDEAARRAGRRPEEVILVAVSKTKPPEYIRAAVEAGAAHIGENYMQEAVEKIEALGDLPARWHFIGHLQRNKARFAAEHFDIVETVDNLRLARELEKRCTKAERHLDILIQVNVGDEAQKSGVSVDEAPALLEQAADLEHLHIKGLMTIPPFDLNPEEARVYFVRLRELRDELARRPLPGVALDHLSMGMSADFPVAIEEGATMVRVGTAIFGAR